MKNHKDMAKIKVYGKAQNRIALGIIHAYMVMHPKTTLMELRNAFPNSLNLDSGVKENFIYAEEKGTTANWDGYFKADSELITMGDGRMVSVVKMWTKPSLSRIVDCAKTYDIEIEQLETKVEDGFKLEYLNGYEPKKRKILWEWLLAILRKMR